MRRRLNEGGGIYFPSSSSLNFVHTGCTVLDLVMGNGWPLGRVVNIVGDQSSGKTLLGIEGMSNFFQEYPRSRSRYNESEAAFIPEYASALGLPVDRVEFTRNEENGSDPSTVEKFYRDIDDYLKKLRGKPGMYVLDSLDALSDEAEIGRGFEEGTYGTGKAKQMSQLFRRIAGRVEDSQVCLMIISQTRDRISSGFGRKYSRSGGRALDFYSSIIIYLAHIGEITRTIKGVKRSVGVRVKAKCTKNKIGLPFRSCEFPIIFGFGVEDVTASLDWLHQHKRLGSADLTIKEYKELKLLALRIGLGSNYEEIRDRVSKAVRSGWKEVESSFLPKRGKYQR